MSQTPTPTPNKFLAFDIECATAPTDAHDWKDARPLGITCAAFAWYDEDGVLQSQTVHGVHWEYGKAVGPAERMSQDECRHMVDNLYEFAAEGYQIVTWNGLGFDFDILAEEADAQDECRVLAMDHHVDPMFQLLCLKGYPVSLNTVAQGMGLPGKTDGMDGLKAVELWKEGRFTEVLDYVRQDAVTTLRLAHRIAQEKAIRWESKAGRGQNVFVPRLLTPRQALTLPSPNTSWMKSAMPRERFYAWTERERV